MMVLSQSFATEVNVYSSRQEALIKPLLERFTEQSGVEVNLVTGKADALLARVKSEGQFTPADLILLADAGRLVRAKEMGLTQALNAELLSNTHPQLQDSDAHWIALTKRARPIMYKLGTIEPQSIKSIDDLTQSRFKGEICIRSSSNIYNQSMLSAMIEIKGEQATLEWAKGLVNNFARSPKGGDRDQIKAMVAGECKIAIANTYYLGGMLTSKDPATRAIAEQVGVIWHDQDSDGVHINVSGAAMSKYSKNVEQAKQLLAYMLQAEAQQWYAEANHEYPVLDQIPLSEALAKFGGFKAQEVSLEKVGQNNAKPLMLMDRAGWK